MLRALRAMWRVRGLCGNPSVPLFATPQARQCARHLINALSQPSASRFAQAAARVGPARVVIAGDSPPGQQQRQAGGRAAHLLQCQLPSHCSGCGVKLQQDDPERPGYFQIPKRLSELVDEQVNYAAEGLSPEEKERRSIDLAMEAWLDEQQRPAVATSSVDTNSAGNAPDVSVRCARCFSLVHYGKVKSEAAESMLPEFDLGKKVGRKIALQMDRRATILCVVDMWDFDGSLPRQALKSLLSGHEGSTAQNPSAGSNVDDLPFQLAVAVNKFDLLPSQATPKRVEQWVRTRLQQAGLPRPDRVFMVSALNGLGVEEMCRTLKERMGFRAGLWVVGAQNAGKSSLINAMKKLGGTGGKDDPTVAPVPGTTLGLLRVPGIPLGPKHRTFDTPGVHHPYQLTSMLNLEEGQAVLPRRRLKPRTYRTPAGSTVLIGGLARVDIVSAPSATLYMTIFVSDEVVTHLGKTKGADERRQKHTGGLLVPPFEQHRLEKLPLVERSAVVEGNSWHEHAKDIAIAGLGWISVGCEGTAEVKVWAPEGVSITVHDPLIPDYAKVFQKPGFSNMLPRTAKKRQQRALSALNNRGSGSDDSGYTGADSSGGDRQVAAASRQRQQQPLQANAAAGASQVGISSCGMAVAKQRPVYNSNSSSPGSMDSSQGRWKLIHGKPG